MLRKTTLTLAAIGAAFTLATIIFAFSARLGPLQGVVAIMAFPVCLFCTLPAWKLADTQWQKTAFGFAVLSLVLYIAPYTTFIAF